MDFFRYRSLELFCEDASLADIAVSVGTPAYVYSAATVTHHYRTLAEAFAWAEPLICYSIKANANLAVLKLLADLGAGFDVVSGGEIHRALAAGADPAKIAFAGVGKTDAEIELALRSNIGLFTVESEPEAEAIEAIASRLHVVARAAVRLNPDVDPKTHTYISTGKRENKFGLDAVRAASLLARRGDLPHVRFVGVHMHLGGQVTTTGPYVEALTRLAEFVREQEAAGHALDLIDMGGGYGIFYKGDEAFPADELSRAVRPILEPLRKKLLMEPGRFIVGNAGVLLARVTYVKHSGEKRFVIVDAGMNDLIRPVLYGAEHRIWPVRPPFTPEEAKGKNLPPADIVGPLCETGDFLALRRPFPEVKRGDVLAVFTAGAYGMTMSSNYNQRPRAPEVLVEGAKFRIVRRRETMEDLLRLENVGGERRLPRRNSKSETRRKSE
jgi:diaminopimelate decarboxylase